MNHKKVFFTEDMYYIPGYNYVIEGNTKKMLNNNAQRLLESLVKADGACISYDQLVEDIWGMGDFGTTDSLRQTVRKLREVLGDKIPWEYIKTNRGNGYYANIYRVVDDKPIESARWSSKGYRIRIGYLKDLTPIDIFTEFPLKIYNYISKHPDWMNKYGLVGITNNKKDFIEFGELSAEFSETRFFIITYYKGLFDSLRSEIAMYKNNLNIMHTLFKEILTALILGTECISICCGDFSFEENSDIIYLLCEMAAFKKGDPGLTDIYYKRLTSGRVYRIYNEEEIPHLMKKLSSELAKSDYKPTGMNEMVSMSTNENVFLTSKRDTENNVRYNFYNRYSDAVKLSILNYAASSIILGGKLASVHEKTDELKVEFDRLVKNGEIVIDFIFEHPYSMAAREASRYKMDVHGRNKDIDVEDIIIVNLTELINRIRNDTNLKKSINIRLTDIALPYALIMSEHANTVNNHMKIDIYSPVPNDDRNRPSFYLLENNPETEYMYNTFRDTFVRLGHEPYSVPFDGTLNLNWMCDKTRPFIHRAMFDKAIEGHTRSAVEACIIKGLPIEVDLLELSDNTIIVGRSDELSRYGWDEKCTYQELINELLDTPEELMTLDEFLDIVRNQVPIIIEIKSNNINTESNDYICFVEKLHKSFNVYLRKYSKPFINDSDIPINSRIAIHSTNPYIIRDLKLKNCMLPCGLISLDFSRIEGFNNESFLELHEIENLKMTFNIAMPDFISYDIISLDPERCDSWEDNSRIVEEIRSIGGKNKIPLLLWTVHKKEDMKVINRFAAPCNYIIEGATEI